MNLDGLNHKNPTEEDQSMPPQNIAGLTQELF
jgi:hypothetical protein